MDCSSEPDSDPAPGRVRPAHLTGRCTWCYRLFATPLEGSLTVPGPGVAPWYQQKQLCNPCQSICRLVTLLSLPGITSFDRDKIEQYCTQIEREVWWDIWDRNNRALEGLWEPQTAPTTTAHDEEQGTRGVGTDVPHSDSTVGASSSSASAPWAAQHRPPAMQQKELRESLPTYREVNPTEKPRAFEWCKICKCFRFVEDKTDLCCLRENGHGCGPWLRKVE